MKDLVITIGAQKFPVVIEPELSVLGETTDSKIKVRSLSTPNDWLTVFHECLHALAHIKGMKLSERDVRTLEQDLVVLLRENPVLALGLLDRRPPRGR